MADPRIRYETLDIGAFDIHVRTLRDRQQFSDDDGVAEALGIGSADWSYFGVVWEGGRVLANLMADFDVGGRSVLEVGCGIGLASLVLNKRALDVTATDHHPSGGTFMAANCALNEGPPVRFVRCGWTDETCDLGRFDLIIGSDLLYERGHAAALSTFIDRHANAQAEVIIIDPGRGAAARFSKHMQDRGYRVGQLPSSTATGVSCRTLHFTR